MKNFRIGGDIQLILYSFFSKVFKSVGVKIEQFLNEEWAAKTKRNCVCVRVGVY